MEPTGLLLNEVPDGQLKPRERVLVYVAHSDQKRGKEMQKYC